jgi:hypothetical protein
VINPLFVSHPGMDILPVTNERWADKLCQYSADERGRLIVFLRRGGKFTGGDRNGEN